MMQITVDSNTGIEDGPAKIFSDTLNAVRAVVREILEDWNAGRFKAIEKKRQDLESTISHAAAFCISQGETLTRIPDEIRKVQNRMNTKGFWDAWTLGFSRARRVRQGEKEISALETKRDAAKFCIERNQEKIADTLLAINKLEQLAIESATRLHASIKGWIGQLIMTIVSAVTSVALFLTNEFPAAVDQMINTYEDAKRIGRRPPAFA